MAEGSTPRRRRFVALALGLFVVVVGPRLPLRSALLALGLKTRADVTRAFLLTKLERPSTGHVVYLLGTTHDRLFFDDDFSIWHIKSALTSLDVDKVLVEVLADDLDAGRTGDGPVEMPFVVGVARARGLRVAGIDARWDDGWRARQDAMFARVHAELADTRAAVVVCGYLHLRAFRGQLRDVGFVDAAWTTDDAEAALSRPVPRTLSPGFRTALRDSLERALRGAAGHEPFAGAAPTWFVDVRRRVLSAVERIPEDPA